MENILTTSGEYLQVRHWLRNQSVRELISRRSQGDLQVSQSPQRPLGKASRGPEQGSALGVKHHWPWGVLGQPLTLQTLRPEKTWHLFPPSCFPTETEETRQAFLKDLSLSGDWLDIQCTNIPACLIKREKLLLFTNYLLKQKVPQVKSVNHLCLWLLPSQDTG